MTAHVPSLPWTALAWCVRGWTLLLGASASGLWGRECAVLAGGRRPVVAVLCVTLSVRGQGRWLSFTIMSVIRIRVLAECHAPEAKSSLVSDLLDPCG